MSSKTTENNNNNKYTSTIPLLDGTNFGHWNLKMKIYLRSRDLLYVCEKRIPSDASSTQVNKWAKASYEAVDIITTRVVEKVFREVLNSQKELLERPDLLLTRLQDYASLYKDRNLLTTKNSTALITHVDEPHKIVYFCKKGKHNSKCTNHCKEECWAENPHLRPIRKDKKQKYYNGSAHLCETQALIITQDNQTNENSLIVDCGATHHMFNTT
ncbi:hypothetical protein O181_018053 [Austropuccinia psidii MF-1]|uniref:DUF4219 domain-containing protein n=1 Tax=Austropuccinia psidii MF-1 TaxID=1389203 RepID=A0A9Q3C788_9BASI|nr:hypothetical protein [Austropuccinia psidii MF-1]